MSLSIIYDIVFKTEGLQKLADLAKDLRSESEMELWIKDLVQAASIL